MYCEMFQLLPVTIVTAFQGHCEWHIACQFSLTSTNSHSVTKALLRHYLDLKYNLVCQVCEFMCKNYDYEKIAKEHAWREAEDTEEKESPVDQNTYSDKELIEHGVPTMAKEWEVLSLTVR